MRQRRPGSGAGKEEGSALLENDGSTCLWVEDVLVSLGGDGAACRTGWSHPCPLREGPPCCSGVRDEGWPPCLLGVRLLRTVPLDTQTGLSSSAAVHRPTVSRRVLAPGGRGCAGSQARAGAKDQRLTPSHGKLAPTPYPLSVGIRPPQLWPPGLQSYSGARH